MTPSDRQEFATIMYQLFSIYRQEVTKLVLDAWWAALQEYDLKTIARAATLHHKDPKQGRFPPMVADIVRHITETMPAMRRERRDGLARQMQDELNAIHDLLLRAEADNRLGLFSDDEFHKYRRALERQSDAVRAKAEYRGITAPQDKPPKQPAFLPYLPGPDRD